MSEKEYMVAQQILFIDPEHFDAIMNRNMFFTPVAFPPKPTSIWGRLAALRSRRGKASPNRFRVVVPLHKEQNLRRTRKRIVVRIFMADKRMDIAYNPRNSYFGKSEPVDVGT